MAVHQGRRVYAVTRTDDEGGQSFAGELSPSWAGDAVYDLLWGERVVRSVANLTTRRSPIYAVGEFVGRQSWWSTNTAALPEPETIACRRASEALVVD